MSENYWDKLIKGEQPPLAPLPESAKMYTRTVEPLPESKEEMEEVTRKMFGAYNDAKWWELDY